MVLKRTHRTGSGVGVGSTSAPHIRAEAAKIKRNARSAAQQLAHHLGRIIDHRNDTGVVEPGRPDHAEHPHNVPGGVTIRRHDGGGTRQRKQLVFRADKDAHAFGLFGAAEQIDDLAPRLEIVEQQAYPLEVGERLEILEQMRLTAHDQFALFLLAARPARQTLGHDLLGQLVELRLALLERAFDLRLDLIERMAADARIEKIAGLGQRRSRQADRNIDDAILDLAVLADQDHHGALGSSRTNSICLSRGFALAVSTTPAARLKPESRPEASVSTASTDLT